jgi:uncharacterized protein YdeI (YjbR/CyaY-like superfamily)
MGEPEIVRVKDRAAWRRWLKRNHARGSGVWLVITKKGSPTPGLSYEQAVEEALCFGWIDSKPNKLDDERFKLWLSPRKPGSVWSRINKGRIERAIREGLMTEAGLTAIEGAKRDGSWNTLDAVDDLVVPDDLAQALRANPDADRHFGAFPPSTRKGIIYWVQSAKRSETRAKRIAETVLLAAENVRVTDRRPPA